MTKPIHECLINKKTSTKPIWFMRQAGRYLPEFRKIRKLNPNFIKLCLNNNLCSKITLQPLKRFNLSAAIIFSDILMVPYGLKQKVNFKKNFGPQLEDINLKDLLNVSKDEFIKKLQPIYNSIKNVKSNNLIKKKNLIGFVGAPWTLLIYMINKKSQKKKISNTFFRNKDLIEGIKVILSKNVTMSKITKKFEKVFSKKMKIPYSLMVNSGSSANLLALQCLINPYRKKRLKKGDEVLIPSICWSTSSIKIAAKITPASDNA